jgi:hypothetical protein
MEHSKGGKKMPISKKGKVILVLVLAVFVIALIPKHTIAGNKAGKITKLHHKGAHHRGDRIGKLDCASGEISKFDGSRWICAPDDKTDTVGELYCVSGEIAKFDGSEWICAPDDNTDTLNGLSCNNGEIAKFNGSEWVCMPDDDTLGVLDCDDGEVAKFNRFLDEWECALVDGGGAPGDCPDGFVALNNNVCIEEFDTDDGFSWFDANSNCINSDARLCSPGEWIAACQADKLDSHNYSSFEWTNDMTDVESGGSVYMAILKLDNCTYLRSASANFNGATFRCCLDR